MTVPASGNARFFLTRTAAQNLRDIHVRSRHTWGEAVADRYMSDIYAAMREAAGNPEMGRLRQHRSVPFRMIPARQHFVIYDSLEQGIVVLTIQHQVRHIEALMARLTPTFLAEIDRLKKR
jgi:toxin ParE1/3/4